MAADLTTPPTDEEVDAIHRMMLGKIMNPADPWRAAVRTAIEEFQRLRQSEGIGLQVWRLAEARKAGVVNPVVIETIDVDVFRG